MSAKYKVLLEVKSVIDHDCGNYQIGETDFSIHCQALADYIQRYGLKGRDDLIRTLAFLMHKVQVEFEQNPPRDAAQVSASP